MKALSVKQPWANRIAVGTKWIETRHWRTDYRDEILIVSTKRPAIEPAGFALAVAELVDCRPMKRSDTEAALCAFDPALFSWTLADIRRIRPFPIIGRLGIYEVRVQRERLLNSDR